MNSESAAKGFKFYRVIEDLPDEWRGMHGPAVYWARAHTVDMIDMWFYLDDEEQMFMSFRTQLPFAKPVWCEWSTKGNEFFEFGFFEEISRLEALMKDFENIRLVPDQSEIWERGPKGPAGIEEK